MADVSKYGEVKELYSSHLTDAADRVNKELAQGWEIITVKVIEQQYRIRDRGEGSGHIEKNSKVCYVLGKPRTPGRKKPRGLRLGTGM